MMHKYPPITYYKMNETKFTTKQNNLILNEKAYRKSTGTRSKW